MIQPSTDQYEVALYLARRHFGEVFTTLAVRRIPSRARRVAWIVSELKRQGLQYPPSLKPFEVP